MDCSPPGASVHGDSPGKNTGVGCHALLQGTFLTQGSNPGLLHCRRILYRLSHQGSPRILEWVAYPFSNGSLQPRNGGGVSYIAGGFFSRRATGEAHRTAYQALNHVFWPPPGSKMASALYASQPHTATLSRERAVSLLYFFVKEATKILFQNTFPAPTIRIVPSNLTGQNQIMFQTLKLVTGKQRESLFGLPQIRIYLSHLREWDTKQN